MTTMSFNEDLNKEIPNEVEFGDQNSAITYAKKLREFGYIVSVTQQPPYWIVTYKKKFNTSYLFQIADT
jgi:hypothetical protein